jgi:prolyl-tRNA synthetase
MKEKKVVDTAEKIYSQLIDSGVDALLDDRDLSAGFKFKDADLLGTPLRITIGSRNLKNDKVEIKFRTEKESSLIMIQDVQAIISREVRRLHDSTK